MSGVRSFVRPSVALLMLGAALLGGVQAQALQLGPSAGPALARLSAGTPWQTQHTKRTEAPAAPARTQTLGPSDREALAALFTKVRPATLRLEICPTNTTSCADPDGIGSGVLIGPGGLALTAYHVVFQADRLVAVTSDKRRFSVKVVGFDDQHDLAVLKVNVPQGTPYLPLAKSAPSVSDPLLAVGNGGGEFLRSQTGRLISLNAAATRADFPPGTLEMSARLIPGDSGGPVLNAAGEVQGIVSYIRADGDDESSIISYAVPVTQGDALVAALRGGTKREAPVIGVGLDGQFGLLSSLPADKFAEFSRALKLQLGATPGAFFTSVVQGSPAGKAGLRPLSYDQKTDKIVAGDLVTAVNGKRVVNFSEFQYAVRTYAPGDTVTLSVVRGGKTIRLKLTLAARSTVRN